MTDEKVDVTDDSIVRVTGTNDPAEIAAVLAAVSAAIATRRALKIDEPTAYTQWRRTRVAALRRDLSTNVI